MLIENQTSLVLILISICICTIIVTLIVKLNANPFKYPYFDAYINITGMRMAHPFDVIDRYLCNADNWQAIQEHQKQLSQWKMQCKAQIMSCKTSFMRKKRIQQFKDVNDGKHGYRFYIVRTKTLYRQVQYVRSSYKADIVNSTMVYDYRWLKHRRALLERCTGCTCTLQELKYRSEQQFAATQRRLMTPALRHQIMERDHYTCQMCGKYMPDEVGLQIDHIIPVSKGGETVPSNLQVLCDKCNRKKSNKIMN